MMLSVPRLSRLPGTASILAEAIAAQAVARVESGERGGSRGAVAAGASTAGTSVGIRGDRDDEGVRLLEPERLARPARGRTGRVDGARGASEPARALVCRENARGAETGRRRAGQDAQPGPVGCGAADVFGRRREVVAQASSRCEYHRQDACATKTYRQDAWATDFQRGNERLCLPRPCSGALVFRSRANFGQCPVRWTGLRGAGVMRGGRRSVGAGGRMMEWWSDGVTP